MPNMATYTINLEPKTPCLHARQLAELCELYLREVARKAQQKTVYTYREKLRYVLRWWDDAGPKHDYLLGADELVELNDWLDAQTTQADAALSFNTRNDVLRRLRQCLGWAYRKGYIAFDLARDVPTPRGMTPPRRVVDVDVLGALLRHAAEGPNPDRTTALLALLAGTGIRCEECVALHVSDVCLSADNSGYATLRTTKNDKPRTVAIDAPTGGHLRAWLEFNTIPDRPLFPSRNGKGRQPLSPSGAYKLIVDLAEAAGVRDQIQGPHDLRRMFATLWLRKLPGKGYGELLQKQLGHTNWATTQKYSLQDVEQIIVTMRAEAPSPMAQLAARRAKNQRDEFCANHL